MTPAPKKVCVCGSRDFADKEAVWRKLDALTYWFDSLVIVTGACPTGPDLYAEEWAFAKRHKVLRFHADWDAHGKAAGPIRNREMAEYLGADGFLIAFWNGESRGTKNMIEEFSKLAKASHLRIVRV